MSKKPTKKNKNKSKKKKGFTDQDTLKGTLDITRSGVGYVIVPDHPSDVLVRPGDFNTALHGDTVRVRVVNAGGGRSSGRQQGKVVEVVQRKQKEFMGKIEIGKNFAFFIPDVDKPMPDIFVPLTALKDAQNNDRVIVRITEWLPNKKPNGEVVQVMQAGDVNDMAMKDILMQNGFPLEFPDDVIEETARIPDTIPQSEIDNRKDVRDTLTFTIDPVDAKDFDDAISIRVLKNGYYEIGVHIADVGHYVEPGTALDEEAYTRATSVYLPDRVLPMLPERISNELCSLRPHEDKLTFSAIFQINDKGDIKNYWLGKTVIHSDHRFTYEEVQEIIEQGEGLYRDEIVLLNTLAQKFRKQRFRKGAINFSSQEVRFKLDEKGKPIGIVVKESKEAHQLIEEFMLLANRVVAESVSKVKLPNKKEVPFPYRVHDKPDEMKLEPFAALARKYGHEFDTKSPEAIAKSFNQLLKDVQGKPEQHVLEQLGIRTMAKAIYTAENIGHYGLGFKYYCHFTSPIRRYPDVLVHRVLFDILNDKVEADKKMEQKCKHCSEKERSAMESERAANKYKQVEYMQNFLGDEFEGVISGVASFGFWVETVEHKCEGLVSINSLSDYDDFRHVESDYQLVGMRSGRKFRMGDKVRIKVVAANLTKRQLDYEWVITATTGDDKVEAGLQQLRPARPPKAPKGPRGVIPPGKEAGKSSRPKKKNGKKK
ncbi:ribonuclease R [Paraflavitalea pollutisoli]|uniref:ribonuclease R n=1 Tax=Paraflavitalea pollutisoli TaxID=3034143 RepID=UPI0023EC4A1F|nr:ribonuclease R [Paraflavitalea sp. H1-2-19X]